MRKPGFKYKRQVVLEGQQVPLFLLLFTVFPVILIWILELTTRNLPFTLSSVKVIHVSPAIWLADLLPAIVFVVSRYILRTKMALEAGFSRRLEEKDNDIKTYAGHAMRIGRGDFSTPVVPRDDSDELGKALQLLQGFLKATQRKESNQSWISEGKDLISRILRINTDLDELAFQVMKTLANYIGVEQGAFYIYDQEKEVLSCLATYAYNRRKFINQEFRPGQGLVGQCAYEQDFVYRTEIPDDYVTITSGILGDQKPQSILLIPLITDERLQGVIEFASVKPKIPKLSIQFLLELGEVIARTVYNLSVNLRTKQLLEESRVLTRELKKNEAELQENAREMEATQDELKKANLRLQAKIREAGEAQGKLHWLLENASEVISIYDENMQMTYISPSTLNILGYSQEEMMQGKDFERLNGEDAAALRKLLLETAENSNTGHTIRYSFVTRDGSKRFLESSARNLLDDPSIKGIIVNTRDITEKMRAEREERLKSRMQSLSENSLDMIVRMSVSGQVYYANPVVEDYLSVKSTELLNKRLSEVEFPEILHDYFTDALRELKDSPMKTNNEIAVPLRMGEKLTERILSLDAIPETNSGELETILFVGHDITESKRIEKEIQEKNKKIEDSIRYAEKIQVALLPDIEKIEINLPRSFVYYKPRDVISGDFPWFFKKDGIIFIAAVDCTGHGVPGALLSFIAFFLMKDVIEKSADLDTGLICNRLHDQFRETLKQNTSKSDARDGMDIALCKIDMANSHLEYTGAHRPLYLLSGKELTAYKGDRKAIGGIPLLRKTEPDFTCHSIHPAKGDKIFFFTDGLTDQLGGPYGRKYSPKRVREQILEHPGYTMMQYHELFNTDFNQWQKGFKQLDDVLMIGIEF